MPCGSRFSVKPISVSALNTVRGASYARNYYAKNGGGGGSCPTRRAAPKKPAPVKPDATLVNLFNQAKANCTGNGILKFELGNVLKQAGFDGSKPVVKDSAQAKAIQQAVTNKQFITPSIAALATKIANGDQNALKEALNAKPPIDRKMADQLDCAAQSGQGITKAELKNVLKEHAFDGNGKGVLATSEKQALKRSIQKGDFARATTAELANKIASGKGVSLIGIRQV